MSQPPARGVVEWLCDDPRPAAGPQTHPDLVCLSHLRWHFVFQRPQHLMTRFARDRRVFFVEEPVTADGPPRMRVERDPSGVLVATPHLPAAAVEPERTRLQYALLVQLLHETRSQEYTLWYLTPMALAFTRTLDPVAVVYDCMDELAAFAFAPPALLALEQELLETADVVFTGGRSLYEAKRSRHPNVHCAPSSVDVPHFAQAREAIAEPPDQAALARPRLGYFGVIDERMDLALVDAVASARPDWQLVLVGPVAKIDAAALPRRANVHVLGAKPYGALPAYLAGWDVALLPFARNEATRFISPTKTPEYLAAGRPVVSTPVRDVVSPYGELDLVEIAESPEAFVAAIERALARPRASWLARVDAFLADLSWDRTWTRMQTTLDALAARRRSTGPARTLHFPPAPGEPGVQPADATAARGLSHP